MKKNIDGFGLRLDQWIRENCESQREFAKKLGVRDSTVSMWIWGEREPRLSMVARICKTFEISADWLLTGDGKTKIHNSCNKI